MMRKHLKFRDMMSDCVASILLPGNVDMGFGTVVEPYPKQCMYIMYIYLYIQIYIYIYIHMQIYIYICIIEHASRYIIHIHTIYSYIL